jgi:hypothetical protein
MVLKTRSCSLLTMLSSSSPSAAIATTLAKVCDAVLVKGCASPGTGRTRSVEQWVPLVRNQDIDVVEGRDR